MTNWKDELKNADVDVDSAIARFCGKEDRYAKYLRLFYADNNYEMLIEALDKGDCEEAFEHCHSLKGVVGNLGFRRMFPNIYDACEKLRAGDMTGVKQTVEEVGGNYHTIMNIIKNYLCPEE